MAANQVDFKILPSDQFSVYSPQTRSDKVITYFTLLSKLRGDILSVGQDDDPNDIVSAFYSSVGGTQTLHLVKADGSEITASQPEQTISGTVNFVSKFTTANDIGDSQIFDNGTNVGIGTTSMTHKLQLATGGVFADYYQLDTTYSNGFVVGAISWDIDNGTADIGLSSTLKLKVGQDDTWYVKNQSGSTITKGTVVYASGTLGASGRITIAPMIANGTIPSRFLLGIVAESILNGADGYVIAKGKIRQINTNAFNDGDVLWVSPTVAGALTVTEPTAPNLKLAIAFVVHKATNGIIAVRATTGVRIADASDVEYAGAADNSFLVYNSATGVWEDEAVGIFKTIAVAGQSSVVADNYIDTLTLTAGTGVTITTNAGTDTITISAPGATGGTVTSINITAGPKILSSGGPITTSGSITVSHEGTTPSDLVTMTAFINYVVANGGIVEAVGPVGEVLAPLTGYEVQPSTSNSGGTVLQNIAVDAYGHVNGVGSITLDTDDIIEGSTNLYFTNARARAAISTTATGLTYTSATGVLSLTAGYIIPTTTQETNWDAAYNDKINSASFNTSTGVITLTQQDAGTVTVDIDGRFINLNEKAAVNGVATLDAGGKVPTSQLPGGLLIYKGTWDAATNTPTLANGTGSAGDTYLCNVAGTVNFGAGNITFAVGDLAIYNGTIWERSGSASDVTSVNGFQGAVVLDLDDINDVDITSVANKQFIVYDNTSSTWKNRLLSYFTTDEITEGATNLFFTTARAQAAINAFPTIAVSGQSNVVADAYNDTLTLATSGTGFTITTDASTDTITFTNTLPDQTVVLTAGSGIGVTGAYPTFTIANTSPSSGGTVTSISTTAPITGGTITTTGTIGITQSSGAADGYLSSADWTTFNSKEPSLTKGNLTEATSAVLTISGGTNAVIGSGTTIAVSQATTSTSGYLSSTDWNTFNAKEPVLTKGNLTEATSSILTITGGTGSVIGSGTTIAVSQATGSSSGYLSSADWTTFNNKASDSFKTIAVTGQSNVVADSNSDTLTLAGAGGVTITTDASTDTITISSTSGTVTSVAIADGGGLNITGSPITSSGTITIENTDRGSGQSIFKNFAVTGSATVVADNNDDTVTFEAGAGITLTSNASSDTITITNSAPSSGGTVTSVAALTIGTTGTDLSSTVADGTTTPVITLQVPTASAANRGALSSTDWTTFNSKVGGSGTTNYVAKFTAGSTIGDSQIFDNGTSVGIGEPTPTAKLHVNGGAKFAGDINLGYGSASEYQVTIGQGRTGDGFAYIDLVGDTTYSDYGLRIIRGNGGANTTSTIVSRGTGEFQIRTEDNAPIVFYTSAADRGRITGAGNFGINEANPTQKLHISGNLRVTGAYYDSSNSAGSSAQVLSSTGSGTQWVNANAGTVTSVGLTAGTGITVSGGPITSSGSITVTNDDRGSSQNIFKNIAVTGQSDIVADTNNDTLTVAAGTGISITTNSTTDTLTITNTAASLNPKTESINIRATVPYSVTTPFDDVVIDTVDVKRNAPNTVTSTSKLLAMVTLEVNNTGSTGFTGFTLRLFNQTTSAAVTNTTTKWSAYMYPAATEFGFTSFTYHIPIDDTSITASDSIQLQLQLEVGTCDISIANFTLMSISK